MRCGKQQIVLANQEKIRMPEEKENHKYLRILEADNIKQAKMKGKKLKKSISRERENYSKQSYKAETSSKG